MPFDEPGHDRIPLLQSYVIRGTIMAIAEKFDQGFSLLRIAEVVRSISNKFVKICDRRKWLVRGSSVETQKPEGSDRMSA